MMSRIGLGLRAQKGGAVAAAVAIEAGAPVIRYAGFVATASEGDRLALEPCRVAYEMAQAGGDPAAAAAEGRKRQDAAAQQHLEQLAAQLDAPVAAGLLVNRAGWIRDLVAYSLEWAEHVPVAEGLAVREALRFGLRQCGIAATEYDEKSLVERAEAALGLSVDAIEAQLKTLGSGLKPWRKEQKLAALAGWLAAVG